MTPDEARREEIRIMSLPGVQEKFRERMGEWKRGDRYIIKDEVNNPVMHYSDLCGSCEYEVKYPEDVFRFPFPIDPVNPTRGLWGMVNWRTTGIMVNSDGNIKIIAFNRWKIEAFNDGYRDYATPTLALLRALARQIGVEVE